MSTLIELKKRFKTQEQIARQFGISQSAVSQWFEKERIPLSRILKASEITGIEIPKIILESTKNTH